MTRSRLETLQMQHAPTLLQMQLDRWRAEYPMNRPRVFMGTRFDPTTRRVVSMWRAVHTWNDTTESARGDHRAFAQRDPRPTVAESRRNAFIRGVDVLHNEQIECEALKSFSTRDPYVVDGRVRWLTRDTFGALSRSRLEREQAKRDWSRLDAIQADECYRHRATYPSAYVANATEREGIDYIPNREPFADRVQLIPNYRHAGTTTGDVRPQRNMPLERWSRDVEAWADLLIRVDNVRNGDDESLDVHRIDVVDRTTRERTTAPDPVAFRGVVRYKLPSPVRVQHANLAADIADRTTRIVVRLVGTDRGWRGHESITFTSRKVQRAIARLERANATSEAKGRKPRSVWTVSERTVRDRWTRATDEQRQRAADITAVLTTSSDALFDINATERVRVVDGASVQRCTGALFGIVDYSRRAALVGITLD